MAMKIKHLLKIDIFQFQDSTKYGAECSKSDENIFYKNTKTAVHGKEKNNSWHKCTNPFEGNNRRKIQWKRFYTGKN